MSVDGDDDEDVHGDSDAVCRYLPTALHSESVQCPHTARHANLTNPATTEKKHADRMANKRVRDSRVNCLTTTGSLGLREDHTF